MQRTVLSDKALPCACKLFNLQGEFKFGVRKKRKNTNKVRAYLFVVRSTQNKWVLTHLVRCTDTACLFVCYVRCARFLQMLCACVSLCLRSVGRSPSCAKMRRAKYRTQASVSAKKKKHEQSSCLSFCGAVYAKQMGADAPRALHLTLRVLFVCYVRCARFLQMLCACSSLCLRSAETCSSAIVTEGQSRATDGVRPNNASIVACKLNNLQGEFKFGVRKKRKNTNKVRAYLFVVRSPRLELGRCNHTPLKRTRLPIPP